MARDKTDKTDATPATTATTATPEEIPSCLYETCALLEARDGNLDVLASHISEGGYLGPKSRDFLTRFLRGDKSVRPRPGNRRTGAQGLKDSLVLLQIVMLTKECGSRYKAENAYLDRHKKINRETLRSQIKRAKAALRSRVNKPR